MENTFYFSITNVYLNSNDSYPNFDHYRRKGKGRNEAYYFLFQDSQLYYNLIKDNIIIVDINKKNQKSFKEVILRLVLNSKLILT